MKVRQITPTQVLPLRMEVLRPGLPQEQAIFSGDELPSTSHWGAFDEKDQLMSIGTLMLAPKPGTSDPLAWQLRGMATHSSVQGQGYGAAVLAACLDYVLQKTPSAIIWCNARTNAVGFYEKFGFKTEGQEFMIPGVGPHYLMQKSRRAP